jgi:hypothetical protein
VEHVGKKLPLSGNSCLCREIVEHVGNNMLFALENFVNHMADCETVAWEILSFTDGESKYPGGVQDILAVPLGLENNDRTVCYPMLLQK